jgi:dTDP-4-amino-4,6-dideoxygalactose transaminase
MSGFGAIALPTVADSTEPVWHLFVVRHPNRGAFRQRLAEQGVETLIHYPIPPHLSGAYSDAGHAVGSLPVAERLADEVLSLPMGPHVSDTQAAQVIEAVAAAAEVQPARAP